jgi:predicted dehydrogenase
VLGAANFALRRMIPALSRSTLGDVTAIASRDPARAREAARQTNIPRAFGSYDDLVADPDIDAIYNPLPNHLHVPWTIRAAEAGKHVLCEKPIALTSADVARLIEVRDRTGVLIQEAFMVRHHPRWIAARDLVRSGRIGPIRAVVGTFSYYNDEAANIRNQADLGGGALLDIGCYLINTARMLLEREPIRVAAVIDRDPAFGTDRLTSMLLDFGGAHAVGTCSTQLVAHQTVQVFGTRGRIEIGIPFNTPPDQPCFLLVDDGSDLSGGGIATITVEACNQYTIQADLFAAAILNRQPAPYPLEDSLLTLRVIESVFRAGSSSTWETNP